jgi:hypothetical protein
MEGAATTVYAQGGRGNSRLMAWEGERTVTFTMEDALISPAGFMILSGAGLTAASDKTPIYVHTTEQVKVDDKGSLYVQEKPHVISNEDYIYVMVLDSNGEVSTEPYIYTYDNNEKVADKGFLITAKVTDYAVDGKAPVAGSIVLVDYYTKKTTNAQQIDITPDKFGGNYYLEASTLFRDTNGVDMPAEFVIPNCKIQSNFTFTMASSGDPSTFTFTMDAFPDYTRFDPTKKVLAAIQIISTVDDTDALTREKTHTERVVDLNGIVVEKTTTVVDPDAEG